MSAKQHQITKKNIRHKRMIQSIVTTKNEGKDTLFDLSTVEGREAAIIRQFNQIQKDYARLMNDVMKEFSLVKGWIGTQAINKKDDLKSLFSARISKDSN
ncbi:MAG: hypothetical protein WC635_17115 [Bacteriovorax sp.]|jgi:hypothetical protein